MSKIAIDPFDQATIDTYRAAYVAANGKEAPAVVYRGRGWFEGTDILPRDQVEKVSRLGPKP